MFDGQWPSLKPASWAAVFVITAGLISSVFVACYFFSHFAALSVQEMASMAVELLPVTISIGGLVLVFMAFTFALIKFNPRNLSMTRFYSWATVGIFIAAVLSVVDSLIFLLFQTWNQVAVFEIALSLFFVVTSAFIVSTGAVIIEQLG